MRIGAMNSYPVFPNWIFTGKVELTEEQIDLIVGSINADKRELTHFGYASHKNNLNPTVGALRKMVGQLFFDNAKAHFKLTSNQLNIESVDAQVIGVEPNGTVPASVCKNRWYQSCVWLQADENSSGIYLDMMDSKLYSTPQGVQETIHMLRPTVASVAFWPAHIPWGFYPNSSPSTTIALINSFIIKHAVHTQL